MSLHNFRSFLPKFAALAVCLAAASMQAQTYTESVIYNFCSLTDCADGYEPTASPVQGTDGNFYGTTSSGGNQYQDGIIYKLTPTGTLTTLHSFCSTGGTTCADGAIPNSSLIQGSNGNFYGTTQQGGAYAQGTFFRITPAGVFTTLYTFCSQGGSKCTDGEGTQGLIKGTDGNFYGTTFNGGAYGEGTVYRMTLAGVRTTLYSFCKQGGSTCPDGAGAVGLVEGSDGNLYGATYAGGSYASGTFYSFTSSGTFTTLYFFCSQGGSTCNDGQYPSGEIAQGENGDFYGTTREGGYDEEGTIYSITSLGALTTIYAEGAGNSPLIQGAGGVLYGVTPNNGNSGDGQAYKITPSSEYEISWIYQFCSLTECTDGSTPSGLIQGADGNLYGTTYVGGTSPLDSGGGVFFKITVSKPASTTALTVTPNPASVGQMVSLQAAVSGTANTPTGSVTFSVNGTSIGSAALNFSGIATLTASSNGIAPGTYPVVATYTGNASYNISQSSTLNVLLNKAFTATTLTASPTSVTPPASVTLTAKVTRSAAGATGTPGGTVTFSYKTETLGTATVNSSGVATLKASTSGIPAGSYAITAAYNGDSDDATSTSSAVSVTVE